MSIKPIVMPKWGLAMEEGMLSRWAVDEGTEISTGQEIMDIETTKIANVFESPVAGVLRRKVVADGETVPVGALLGVVSSPDESDGAIDEFVTDFQANFTPPEKTESSGPVPETVEVGGLRIQHLKAGPDSGVPLVFIHGFGADHNGWMFNQADLAADRPTDALDLPGHGGSAKDVGDGTVATLAGRVVDYLTTVATAPAHLIGHSLGGAIALDIAATAPDRVAALTLIAPAGLGPEINGAFIDGFITQSRARKLRPILEMLVAEPGLVTADMVEEVLKFKRLDGAVAALKTIAAANFDGNTQKLTLRDRLGDIKVPVQVIWGEDDQIIPAKHAEGLPSAVKVTRITGAGHIAQMEKAAEVNALIAALG